MMRLGVDLFDGQTGISLRVFVPESKFLKYPKSLSFITLRQLSRGWDDIIR